MERLTEKVNDYWRTNDKAHIYYLDTNESVFVGNAIDRLGELEDVLEKYGIENAEELNLILNKSENILLANGVRLLKEKNDKLEQELAELKQKAIVPKFRTYQSIFYITQYYTSTKGNPEYDIISDKYYVAENENEIILGWNYAKDFNQRKYYYVCKDWVFATKEEAEQKLAEIKGE